ncbi:MAG: hypothetical protein AAB345_03850 [Patescibacteria group bacterium]
MATDCEKLSPAAKKIFDKLKPFYPPDPWRKPRWEKDGVVIDNGTYDLRRHADRKRLEDNRQSFLGYMLALAASIHRDGAGSMQGFTEKHFSEHMQQVAEQLLLLRDLDFQIETVDLVDDC